MKNHVARAKKFVQDHQTALAVTATVITMTALHIKIVGGLNDFLAEHDLTDEYYTPEDES